MALRSFLGNYQLIVLDEAQYISDIGRILKIIADTFPEIQVIATGSSSFELGNRISEPLTGRSREYLLYPFSIAELLSQDDPARIIAGVERFLRFGFYPEVYGKTDEEAIEELTQISSNYLYRDILQFEQVKRPGLLLNLLNVLALQVGHEVSLNEISRLLRETVPTIQRYIELLEKAYVIFRLRSFSRNLRNEIAKGQLWENFCIVERMKLNQNRRRFVNTWFWRTYDQKEVDYIEDEGGILHAFEFKYRSHKKAAMPKIFKETYPDSTFDTISPDNFLEYLS